MPKRRDTSTAKLLRRAEKAITESRRLRDELTATGKSFRQRTTRQREIMADEAKPTKRKPAEREPKEDFNQAAFRAVQETIRISEKTI